MIQHLDFKSVGGVGWLWIHRAGVGGRGRGPTEGKLRGVSWIQQRIRDVLEGPGFSMGTWGMPQKHTGANRK